MKYSWFLLVLIFPLAFFSFRSAPSVPPAPLAGIVPHHLFVSDIIQGFFSRLQSSRYDNVVVLGPNHGEIGEENIIKNPTFADQSLSSLLPFIDNTFPKAHLTTYLLKRNVSLADCASLAEEISGLSGTTLVIASIDFSHYLTTDQAFQNDELVLSKIKSRDYANILTMNSDYLDSPGSLVTLLKYLDLKGDYQMDILAHDNSGTRGNPYDSTTSYFSIIFTHSLYSTATPVAPLPMSPSPSPVTLLFTGDVMLGRSVGYNIAKYQDPAWPFRYVMERLQSADLTYINLENPLTSACPLTEKGMVFCSDIANVAGLVSAGVDVASLANNHTTNYGGAGLRSTLDTLEASGIRAVGLGTPVTLVRNGQVFTYLSFNDIGPYPGIANVDQSTLSTQIAPHQSEDNILIVTFHWGHEYQRIPSQRQVSLAHQAIDAGADLVIGAHPHWVQTKETYRGKPIYYSLGNFVFDQEWSPETKRGLAVEFTYLNGKLTQTTELPVSIENYGQPHWQ